MHERLTVTAHLSTPPALTWPLMLDAILLAGMGAKLGAAHPSGWAAFDDILAESLPLARVEGAGHWWYACSQITPHGTQTLDYTNRVPMVEQAARLTDARSLNVAARPDKRLRTPVYYRPGMLELTWTCVGDAGRVADLLQYVPGIGKMRTHGRGWVQRCAVTRGGPSIDTYSRPGTRHVPAALDMVPSEGITTRRHLPLRPPYWMRRDAIECWQEVER